MNWHLVIRASLVAMTLSGTLALAQSDEQAAVEDPNRAIAQAAFAAIEPGPTSIAIEEQASIALPEGYGFMPREHAVKLMEMMGNQTGPTFIGLIYPLDDDSQWFVTVDFESSGYIKDEDAKDWDADGLLENLKDGTKAGNEYRKEIGVDPIQVTRWVESPTYDAALRHLIWSAEIRLENGEDPDPGVNYNTYVLGREGYVSMCLVTSLSSVESEKPDAKRLLSAVSFNQGKRYEDFNASTDKVAEYGLAALVGGVVAKKLGLLGLVAAFFVKFGKLLLVGLAVAGASVAKIFKRKASPEN
jgi:uncharacterized membrane-anchored protein